MVGDHWRVPPGARLHLRERDASSTAGAPGDRATTEAAISPLHAALLGFQDRLRAAAHCSVLVILQGIDTSGKDGTISHVFRGLNPLGTTMAVFKVPTPEELGHDCLWRVHARCPAAGEIAIFNRSHYEDVLAARVRKLVPESVWRPRYAYINAFEASLQTPEPRSSNSCSTSRKKSSLSA